MLYGLHTTCMAPPYSNTAALSIKTSVMQRHFHNISTRSRLHLARSRGDLAQISRWSHRSHQDLTFSLISQISRGSHTDLTAPDRASTRAQLVSLLTRCCGSDASLVLEMRYANSWNRHVALINRHMAFRNATCNIFLHVAFRNRHIAFRK